MTDETTDNHIISKLLLLANTPPQKRPIQIDQKEETKCSRWIQMDPGDRSRGPTQQIDPEERSSRSIQNVDLSMVRGSVRARGSVGDENFVYNANGTVGMAYRKLAQERRESYIREY